MNKFPLVIAHRGASSLAPENTLPAFKKAIDMGCDGIELDVQLTKDGEVVVFHDSFLNRTTDGSGFVNERTLPELKKLDAGKHFSDEFKGTKIPTLAEVFKLFENNSLLIIVELKGKQENLEHKVSELIRSFSFEKRAIISSYNHNYLRNVKKIDSSIQTQVDIVWTFEDTLKLAKELKVNSVCPIHYFVRRMWKVNIMRLKANKLKLFTYTVDTKDEMLRMIRKGVDGILTDKPQLLLELKADFMQRKRSLFRKLID